MKIGVVTPTVSPGGLYRVAIEETRYLNNLNFDSKLIALFKPIDIWSELLRDISPDYLASSRFLSPFISELINRNLFLVKKIKGHYDVVICHNLPSVYAVKKSHVGVKKVAYIHDPLHFTVSGNMYHFLFNSTKVLERKFSINWLSEADIILVNSKRSQRTLKEKIDLDSRVLYPTIIFRHDRPLPETREEFFLCVGRIGYHPTYFRLLEIMRQAKHMQLVIAGSLSHSAYKIINIFVKDPWIKERVKFITNPTDRELSSLYDRARAFIYPGIENFNMSAMEAASHGCPIIISKESGIHEILDGYGLVARTDDTDLFVDIVQNLIADEKKAVKEGRKAFECTANYDIHYHMSTLMRFLREVI